MVAYGHVADVMWHILITFNMQQNTHHNFDVHNIALIKLSGRNLRLPNVNFGVIVPLQGRQSALPYNMQSSLLIKMRSTSDRVHNYNHMTQNQKRRKIGTNITNTVHLVLELTNPCCPATAYDLREKNIMIQI